MSATPEQITERHAWQAKVRELAPAASSIEELRVKAGPAPEGMMYVDITISAAWGLAHQTPSAAPRGTKTRGDRRLVDFLPDNSDEEWFHCKAPFLRFAVSNHRRVAWLVTVGHGAKSGKVLKSRSRLVFVKGKPLAVHSVRLQDDSRKQREMNVEWLFENAAGRPRKVRKSSAEEVEVR